MKKRIVVFIITLLFVCTLFSGCSFTILSANDLIRPPKLSGESSFLQQAFEKEVSSEFVQMKTPLSGENRSSYIICDIDLDGNDDGLVLYSDPSSDAFAHIAVFNHNGNEWKLVSNITGLADEIYEVSFNDINGDRVNEVFISWTTLNPDSSYNETLVLGGNRTLTLYKFANSGMTLLKTENYTKMFIKDFDGNGSEDVFLSTVNISMDSNKTTGRIITFDEDYTVSFDESFSLISMLDVVSITSDSLNTAEGKFSRIYVDGVLSEAAFVTDVIKFAEADKTVSFPLHGVSAEDIPRTARSSKVYSCDIDSDGIIEIPTLQELPYSRKIGESDEETVPLNLVVWSQLQDDVLNVDFKSLYNKINNYYFIFESNWISDITVEYNAKNSLVVFYSVEDGEPSEKLFSLIACSENDWNNNKNNFDLLYSSDSFVYGCKYEQNKLVTKQKIKDNFVVMS